MKYSFRFSMPVRKIRSALSRIWALVTVLLITRRSRSEPVSGAIVIERGLFSTTKDNVELFRIDHFDIHRPFGMRLLGESVLHLRSSDPHFPTVMIKGVPDLERLADTLRECSLRERTRRRVTTFVEA